MTIKPFRPGTRIGIRSVIQFAGAAAVAFLFAMLPAPDCRAADATSANTGPWDLNRCIQYAISNNYGLQATEAKLDEATSYSSYVKTQFLPSLNLNASSGYYHGEPATVFGVLSNIAPEELLRVRSVSGFAVLGSVSLDIPLVKEGVFFTQDQPTVVIARANTEAVKSELETGRKELIYEVEVSYTKLLLNNEKIALDQRHLNSQDLLWRNAHAKYDQNLISKNDLLLADSQFEAAKEELAIDENQTPVLMADLAGRMGLKQSNEIRVSPEDLSVRPLPQLSALEQTALANRPEIRAQEMQVRMAEQEIRLAENARYPDVNFTPRYDVANNYGSRTQKNVVAFINVTMTLFNFGSDSYRIRAANAKVVQQEKTLLALKDSIVREVVEAYEYINSTNADIAMHEKNVDYLTEHAKLIKGRFEQNLVPVSDSLEAEYKLDAEENALLSARYDLKTAYFQLEKSLGAAVLH